MLWICHGIRLLSSHHREIKRNITPFSFTRILSSRDFRPLNGGMAASGCVSGAVFKPEARLLAAHGT